MAVRFKIFEYLKKFTYLLFLYKYFKTMLIHKESLYANFFCDLRVEMKLFNFNVTQQIEIPLK